MSPKFPLMVRIRQRIEGPPAIDDLSGAVHQEMKRGVEEAGIGAGDTVAVAAGSRGIVDYGFIVREVVNALRGIQAEPFVFPAMGSHGGATSQGQLEILKHQGITEELLGVPVLSEIEPVELGCTEDGLAVYVDRNALQAKFIVAVNRIKKHTDFTGVLESGILKMLSIGIGKQRGADAYHKQAQDYGFCHMISTVSSVVLQKCPVAFGLAILENGREETTHLEAVPAAALPEREPKLLEQAKALLPRLPFDELDVLIVDWMGKNISGTGMDSNVLGRRMQTGEPELTTPRIKRILVRDLTDDSEGNATGIGFADFTRSRLVSKIDKMALYQNLITGGGPQKGRIPPHYDKDDDMIDAALNTIGMTNPRDARVVRIANTLQLEEMMVSESLAHEVGVRDDLDFLGSLSPMEFDCDGNLA